MESKCSWSDAPWSGDSGAKCLGNYLDHLMLLRVALTAGEPAAVVERSVRDSSLAALGQCALWRPQLQQQQPALLQSMSPEQQRQRRSPPPPQQLGDRSPPLRRTYRQGSAEEKLPVPVPKGCAAPRSPAAPEASGVAAEENIYFELEPTAAAVAGQAEQAAANVARLALERLSALAERGLLDVAAAAAASPCERDGDARRPATVPRAARPHATPERRGAGFRRVSSVADALALAGDCERAAAAGCEQLLFDLCSGDSGEQRWQHRRPQQRTSLQQELDHASPAAYPAAADHRAELSLLADAEPVYETIPCDDADDGDAEFDTVQHSSCSRRRIAARAPRQNAASFEQPPQLPPPRQQQASTQPRSRLASSGESEMDSFFDGSVEGSLTSRLTSDDTRLHRSAAVAVASAEKGPCCSSELQTCRIKMGVAAKKAWDERCVRRPSQTLSVAAAAAAHPSVEGAALAAKCRRNSAAACSATAPSRPAVGLAAPYKALPAVRC